MNTIDLRNVGGSPRAFIERIAESFPDYYKSGIFVVNDKRVNVLELGISFVEYLLQFQGQVVKVEYLENESNMYIKALDVAKRELNEWYARVSSTQEFRDGLKEMLDNE